MDEDLKDDIVRTKALQEMNTNSTVENISYKVSYRYSFKSEWNDGLATMHGPEYIDVNRNWNVNSPTSKLVGFRGRVQSYFTAMLTVI